MVHIARQALEQLAGAGVSGNLFDVYSIPLQTEGIIAAAVKTNGRILVVEDNYLGGFCDEIAAAAAGADEKIKVKQMFVTQVPKSAKTPEEILKVVKLTADDIAQAAKKLCS